jgi:hypothetical protein
VTAAVIRGRVKGGLEQQRSSLPEGCAAASFVSVERRALQNIGPPLSPACARHHRVHFWTADVAGPAMQFIFLTGSAQPHLHCPKNVIDDVNSVKAMLVAACSMTYLCTCCTRSAAHRRGPGGEQSNREWPHGSGGDPQDRKCRRGRPSRLVASVGENRLNIRRNSHTSFAAVSDAEQSRLISIRRSSLQVSRALVNERYRFFGRGDHEPVCLVSKIDI